MPIMEQRGAFMREELKKLQTLLAKEKRKTDRVTLPLEMEFAMSGRNRWHRPLAIEDISGGGMRFLSPVPLTRGQVISLKLKLPDEQKPFSVDADVIWNSQPENTHSGSSSYPAYLTGIRFHKMSPQDRQKFVFYVSRTILSEYLDQHGDIHVKS
ncbi:MAG: hypothetical protein GF333_03190 [Candidatus Omnitrophica bacterium]|nr:hypothetical protein [Candidatus Omnitrophota bacterium]